MTQRPSLRSSRSLRSLPVVSTASAVLALGLLVSCGESSPDDTTSNSSTPSPAAEQHDHDDDHTEPSGTEVAGPEARIAFTHDEGIVVLRASDGEELADIDLAGFNRLSQAGDGRHLMVATGDGFRVLDLAAWTEAHGDHGHSFTAEPHLTELTFAAEKPGHVVVHDDRTVLFDDATGEITSFDPHHLTEDDVDTSETRAAEPHHGVAVAMADGSMLLTLGDDESRSGVVRLDHRGEEVARNEECPGVHGETVASGDAAVFGCENGVLVAADDGFTKVASPDGYGRIGNLAGSPASPVVLGDYKTDRDAEIERPTRVSLIDTESGALTLVDLGASYSFRSLGRGPDGEALVLGTDGALRVIDPERGRVVKEIAVVKKWKEPTEWQQPRPTLVVVGDTAWISEPAAKLLHAVDLDTQEIRTHRLDHTPNEVAGIVG